MLKQKPFKACGLCPINPNVLYYTKCMGAPTVSTSTDYSNRRFILMRDSIVITGGETWEIQENEEMSVL
jgi:hypothetical protein